MNEQDLREWTLGPYDATAVANLEGFRRLCEDVATAERAGAPADDNESFDEFVLDLHGRLQWAFLSEAD